MSDTGAHFSAVTEDICDAIRAKILNLENKLALFGHESTKSRAVISVSVYSLNQDFHNYLKNALAGDYISRENEKPPRSDESTEPMAVRYKFGWALMGPSLGEKMGTRIKSANICLMELLTEDIDKMCQPKLSHMSSNDGYSHGKMKKKFEKLKNEILKTSSFAQMRDILEQGHAKILQNLETRPSIFHICQNAPSLAVANFVLRHHAEKIKDLLPKSVNTVKKALKMEENGNIC